MRCVSVVLLPERELVIDPVHTTEVVICCIKSMYIQTLEVVTPKIIHSYHSGQRITFQLDSSPTLFSIYTDNCRGKFDNIPIIKYADDTSIQALIKSDGDLFNYKQEIYNIYKVY